MAIEKEVHLIPFRTQKLSPSSPMVLHTRVWKSRSPPSPFYFPQLSSDSWGFFMGRGRRPHALDSVDRRGHLRAKRSLPIAAGYGLRPVCTHLPPSTHRFERVGPPPRPFAFLGKARRKDKRTEGRKGRQGMSFLSLGPFVVFVPSVLLVLVLYVLPFIPLAFHFCALGGAEAPYLDLTESRSY